MKLIAEVNFDVSYSFIFLPARAPRRRIWSTMFLKPIKQRLYILQERINQQAMAWSRRMLGTTQRILVEGTSRKSLMELSGRTENNRVVNFEGTPDMVGKFVDVEIVDVTLTHYAAKLSAQKMRWDCASWNRRNRSLRVRENDLGVGIYQP